MNEAIVANVLSQNHGQVNRGITGRPYIPVASEMTPEERAKQEKEREELIKSHKADLYSSTILTLVERLVVERRVGIDDAFKIATELFTKSLAFKVEYKLPEGE